MIRLIMLAVGLIFVLDQPGQSSIEDSSELIIEEYLEKIGGREKLMEVSSMTCTVTFASSFNTFQAEVKTQKPDKFRFEIITKGGMNLTAIKNGDKGIEIVDGEERIFLNKKLAFYRKIVQYFRCFIIKIGVIRCKGEKM